MSMRTAALLLIAWMAAPLAAQQAIYIDSNTPADLRSMMGSQAFQ